MIKPIDSIMHKRDLDHFKIQILIVIKIMVFINSQEKRYKISNFELRCNSYRARLSLNNIQKNQKLFTHLQNTNKKARSFLKTRRLNRSSSLDQFLVSAGD